MIGPGACGILQVEDNESDVLLLKAAFQKAGITTPLYTVTDGAMAISYLAGEGEFADRAKHPLPCLILLDLSLPKFTGAEVLTWIRANPAVAHTVVVVLSSSALPEDIERAYALGANSYLQKPLEYERIIEMAFLIKGWWLGFNHFPPVQAPLQPARISANSPCKTAPD